MEVTRKVIEDLLPLYVSNEASADTRVLVEGFLERDPELARLVREAAAELPKDIPIPLTREDEMEAYKEAKRLMFLRTIILAGLISGGLITVFLVSLLAFKVM